MTGSRRLAAMAQFIDSNICCRHEALDPEVAAQDRHQVDLRWTGQQADHRDPAAEARREEGPRQGAGAAHFDDQVGTTPSGELSASWSQSGVVL